MDPVQLGRFGIWRGRASVDLDVVRAAEDDGFGAVWIGGSQSDLRQAEGFLEATQAIRVATGIVNIWGASAADLGAAYLRVAERFADRFLLGIGTSHPESQGERAATPYEATVTYLDDLGAAGVPSDRIVLAALGPRMIRLAGRRTAGAHPYLVTPAHTSRAREILGAGPLLAPEQRVVLSSDSGEARALGRASVRTPYLDLTNYRTSLLRLGYTEAELDRVDDRLIDDLVVWGDDATIRSRLEAHLDAGADHVAVQIIQRPGEDLRAAHSRLARILDL
jgi:probable F420-dependent oxidoreductase